MARGVAVALCMGILCTNAEAQQVHPTEKLDVKIPFELKKIDGSLLLAKYYKKMDELLLYYSPTGAVRKSGQIVGLFYHIASDTVPSEILNTYGEDLTRQGFQFVKDASYGTPGLMSECYLNLGVSFCGLEKAFLNPVSQKMVTYKKSVDGGDVYIKITAARAATPYNWSAKNSFAVADKITFQKDDNLLEMTMVLPKVTSIALVKEDINFMHDNLLSSGSVNLYGIYFDFNQTVLKPESETTIGEIAKLLQADPALVLGIVGHTDNQGSAQYNQKLSEGRAAAVVADLVQKYGIDSKRLFPSGMGDTKPIVSNDTGEGRAKNRRVELVKRNP